MQVGISEKNKKTLLVKHKSQIFFSVVKKEAFILNNLLLHVFVQWLFIIFMSTSAELLFVV